MSLNPLDPIWRAYQSSRDSFEIAKIVIKHQDGITFAQTHWAKKTAHPTFNSLILLSTESVRIRNFLNTDN
jgi:hypothetical protein